MTLRMRTSGQLPWWFGIPFVLGGLLFAGIGVTFLLDELRYGSEGVSVAGTVTDLEYSPGSGDDGPSYTIRYAFTDPVAGIDRFGATDVGEEAFDAASIDGPIEITYLPAEPTKHRVGSPEPQLLFPLVFIGGGGLFAVIGVGLLLLARAMRSNRLPSWVQVSTGASEAPDEQAAAALAQLFGGSAIASAVSVQPGGAPAAQAQPMSTAELSALDARFAPAPAGTLLPEVTPPEPAPPAPASEDEQAPPV